MATPEEMAQSMIRNLPEKTGRSLKEWLALLASRPETKHGQIVKFLKTEYSIGHGFANLIAHSRLHPASAEEVDLVSAQYQGGKAALRPIYDRLIERIERFGPDLEVAPKKSYVSLRRSKQFGLIQPSTRTRVDVGLNLKGEAPGERLEASGSFNSMVSHRVRISSIEQVDDQLIEWLREAFSRA